MEKEKYCYDCKQLKPAVEFNKASGKRLYSYCKQCSSIRQAIMREALKQEVYHHMSNGANCCANCGCKDMRCLSIDHINGNGSEHRRQLGNHSKGQQFYRWIKANGYPKDLQILCMNCQFIKKHENKE